MLADQRTALTDLLQQLLKQKDQREEELRLVLVSDSGLASLISQVEALETGSIDLSRIDPDQSIDLSIYLSIRFMYYSVLIIYLSVVYMYCSVLILFYCCVFFFLLVILISCQLMSFVGALLIWEIIFYNFHLRQIFPLSVYLLFCVGEKKTWKNVFQIMA